MTSNTPVEYSTSRGITIDEFVDLLERSGLAERRPVEDRRALELMLAHGNLLVSAWSEERLIGVARSVTDFGYCCYLSDLAVDRAFQKLGVGRELIERTRSRLGSGCTLILLAAPAALGYYPRLGFEQHAGAFVLPAGADLL